MCVQSVQQDSHIKLVDIHGGLIGDLLSFFIAGYFVDEVNLLQFVEGTLGQLDGNLAFLGNGLGIMGRLIPGEAFRDEGHHEDGHKFAVAVADVACVLVETEVADILAGIRQLGAKEADGP